MSKMLPIVIALFGLPAFANDGGIAAIKVSDIRMREFEVRNGQERELRRIAKPNFKIYLNGQEAAKLQKILPSEFSVLTHMQPEIADAFNASFKTLGVYSDASNLASAKILTIHCNDAELKFADDGKVSIAKKPRSECTIEIRGLDSGESAGDYFGDMSSFEPKTCEKP